MTNSRRGLFVYTLIMSLPMVLACSNTELSSERVVSTNPADTQGPEPVLQPPIEQPTTQLGSSNTVGPSTAARNNSSSTSTLNLQYKKTLYRKITPQLPNLNYHPIHLLPQLRLLNQ